jgi:hypothetical protein
MDAKLLQRVMDLAEKTGDRVIVVNPKTGAAHAIMPFDSYEELVEGGTASLRDLGDEFDFSETDIDEDDEDREVCRATGIDLDDLHDESVLERSREKDDKIITKEEIGAIEKAAMEEVMAEKIAQQSQKEAGGLTPLDVLDDEANEEQYYLEPLE